MYRGVDLLGRVLLGDNIMVLLRTGVIALVIASFSGPAQTQENASNCVTPVSQLFLQEATITQVDRCISKAAINARDAKGNTPLHTAIFANADPSIVRLLIRKGADLSLRNLDLRTPLHEAALTGSSGDAISTLILHGADINAPVRPERNRLFQITGDTALHLASRRDGAANVVAALLLGGADVGAKSAFQNRRALHFAARAEDFEIADLLRVAGASARDVDDDGNTPLHLAASRTSSRPLLRALVLAGGLVDQGNDTDVTPLMLAAAHNKNPWVLAYMLAISKEPCKFDNEERTALLNATRNPLIFRSSAYWDLHQRCSSGE